MAQAHESPQMDVAAKEGDAKEETVAQRRWPARCTSGGAVTAHTDAPEGATTRRRSARLSGKREEQCIEDGPLERNRRILEMYCGSGWSPVSKATLESKKADKPLEEEEDANDDGNETAEEGTSSNTVHIPQCLRYESGPKSWLDLYTVGESFQRLVATSGSYKTLHPRTFYELDTDEELPGMVRKIDDSLVGDGGLVLLPICHRWHWTLTTVTQQFVVYYDPAMQKTIPLQLRKLFLALNRKVVRLEGTAPKQTDDDSCGVYICLMARNIVEGTFWSWRDAVNDKKTWRSSFAAQLRLEHQAASATNAVCRPVSPGLTGIPPTPLDPLPVLSPTSSSPPMLPSKRRSSSPNSDTPPAKALARDVPSCQLEQIGEGSEGSEEQKHMLIPVESDENEPRKGVILQAPVIPKPTPLQKFCVVNGMGCNAASSPNKCLESLFRAGLELPPDTYFCQHNGLPTKKKKGYSYYMSFGLFDQGDNLLRQLSAPMAFKKMHNSNCTAEQNSPQRHVYIMSYKSSDEIVLAAYFFDLWISLLPANHFFYTPYGLMKEKSGVLKYENLTDLSEKYPEEMLKCYQGFSSLGKTAIEKSMKEGGLSYAFWRNKTVS